MENPLRLLIFGKFFTPPLLFQPPAPRLLIFGKFSTPPLLFQPPIYWRPKSDKNSLLYCARIFKMIKPFQIKSTLLFSKMSQWKNCISWLVWFIRNRFVLFIPCQVCCSMSCSMLFSS